MASWFNDRKGYRRFSDSGEYVHRWVAEDKLGRDLRRGEVVHHINRDKGDNHPDNLYVFRNQRAHDRVHKRDGWY
ncbi:MAG: hypothetical protein FJY86_04555 [Candidatus Diapherotrites archaeon]|uniref:HNH nuclease domain-containing protein n=1 Tax=Candidatus Iainarchaeum sp. TaxID=3101447 RepID=A0A8T4CCC2_9ARCH|nr:hypothetical protein [Candidatus Diapherotrites archaeon]